MSIVIRTAKKKKEPAAVGASAAARRIVSWFHRLDDPEHKRLFVQMLRDEADKLERQLLPLSEERDDDVPF